MKAIKKLLLLFLPFIIIMMMFLMFLGGGVRDGNETPKNNLSSSVEYYRPYVSKIAKLEGMEDYVDLILAVILCRHQKGRSTKNIRRYPMGSRIRITRSAAVSKSCRIA